MLVDSDPTTTMRVLLLGVSRWSSVGCSGTRSRIFVAASRSSLILAPPVGLTTTIAARVWLGGLVVTLVVSGVWVRSSSVASTRWALVRIALVTRETGFKSALGNFLALGLYI